MSHRGPPAIGRYRTLELIGAGGMGELYLGWDAELDRKLAIKLVRSRHRSEIAEQRLRREAKALAQLSHPNVVPVFDVGEHEDRVFIAMEFVEGQSLRTWLTALDLRGIPRTEAILSCFVSAGRGLEAVHAAGLAHRDFKPENVIVGQDDRVRIVDFGLARDLFGEDPGQSVVGAPAPAPEPSSKADADADADADSDSLRSTAPLTVTGALLGTPRYMAPEQWMGLRGDSRSDQFSFCVALYEALYGTRPFAPAPAAAAAEQVEPADRAGAALEALAAAVKAGALAIPNRRVDVPNRVREALLRGLARDPEQRFASMTELLDELQPPPLARGKIALALTVLGLGLVLTALAGVLWLAPQRPADEGGESSLVALRREFVANEHRARVEAQIEALREAGLYGQADAVFAGFVELPDHAGTLALGRAWLRQAKHLEARGALEAELDAYATAYLSSVSSVQQEALFGLAHAFTRTRQWARLGPTLDAIEARSERLTPAQAGALEVMRVAALAAMRDLEGAARLLDEADERGAPGVDPVVRAAIGELARTTTTEHELIHSNVWSFPLPGLDLDGDGIGELLLLRPGEQSVALLGTASPRLPLLGQVELGTTLRAPLREVQVLRDAGSALFSVRAGSQLSLHRLGLVPGGGFAAETLFELDQPAEHTAPWTAGDLDGDGKLEFYLGLKPLRRLLALEPHSQTGALQGGDPHLPTTAAESVIHGVAAGDIDGDGSPELAVIAGEWSAYDLRILQAARPDAARSQPRDPPALELVARRKLGAVQSLELVPASDGPGLWIAVGVSGDYPSRRVFPADASGGVPGLYIFAWDGGALEQVAFLDLPYPTRIYHGDFDGNGLSDLALAIPWQPKHSTVLVLQTEPGRFEPLTLTQLWPVGVLDRDGDGDDELLVVDTSLKHDASGASGALFVLGSGAERLPSLSTGSSTSSGASASASAAERAATIGAATGDDSLRGPIERAEVLAHIGLPLRAAEQLRKLAQVAQPKLAAHLRLRAAELLESRAHRVTAAELYAQAAADAQLLGERTGPARIRAMELFTSTHRFRQALTMAQAALESTTAAEPRATVAAALARLQALNHSDSALVFDFESPLDARWAIDPLAVARRHGRLELALGGSEQGVIARRELHWDGGRLSLEVELELDLVEWGSGVNISLVPLDGPSNARIDGSLSAPFEVGARVWGGGGIYELQLNCVSWGLREPEALGYPIDHPHAELPPGRHRYTLRVEFVPGAVLRWCTAEGEGVHAESSKPVRLEPGAYALEIRGSEDRWSRAKLSIDRITITGAREPETLHTALRPSEALGRELAEGRGEALLARLDQPQPGLLSRERALLRFLALDELGRGESSELALAEALELPRGRKANDCRSNPHTRTLVGLLLRHRPERLGPALRRLCQPDDYFAILFEVWQAAAVQHPESSVIERVFTTQTAGLERWVPRAPEDRLAALTLLRNRAQAWSTQGADGAARAELERAVEFGERWQTAALANPADESATQLAAELGRCRTALAAELLGRGDQDRALDILRDALERSPTPEILADMLIIDERFVRLHERPLWRELVEPARAGLRLGATGP